MELVLNYNSLSTTVETVKYTLATLIKEKSLYVDKLKTIKSKLKRASKKNLQTLWTEFILLSENYKRITLKLLQQNSQVDINSKIKEREILVSTLTVLKEINENYENYEQKSSVFSKIKEFFSRSSVEKLESKIKKLDKELTSINNKTKVELKLIALK